MRNEKTAFLVMAAILAIPVSGYEIFVVETGEFVQSSTIPTVKKTEVRESDQITVTYTFDSLMVVRDSANPDIVCFQPEGFGLIHWDEHAMAPYKMDQYLLPCNEKGALESFTTSSVEYNMEYMPSHNDYSDLDSIPVVSPPIKTCYAPFFTPEDTTSVDILTYIIHSGFISGYQNRYGDNLKPPTNVYHRMTA